MLNKRQVWRKSLGKPGKKKEILESHEVNTDIESTITPIRSHQDFYERNSDSVNPISNKNNVKIRSAMSSTNLSDMANKPVDKRVLRFSSTVQVLLIQQRCELTSLSLFWCSSDYQTFKQSAIKEIRDTAKQLNVTSKAAMKYLYQPPSVDNTSPTSTPRLSAALSSIDLRDSNFIEDMEMSYSYPRDNGCEEDISFIANVKPKVVKHTDRQDRQQNLWAVQWKK